MLKCVRERKAKASLQKCWLYKRAHNWTCVLAKVDPSIWSSQFGWVWDAVFDSGVGMVESSSENWEMGEGQSWVWWVRHQHQPGLSWLILEDLFTWANPVQAVPWACWELGQPIGFVSELKHTEHGQLCVGWQDGLMAGLGSCSSLVLPNTSLCCQEGWGQEPRAWLQGQHSLRGLPDCFCWEMREICCRALCMVLPFGANTTPLVCCLWSVFLHIYPVRWMGSQNVRPACMGIRIQREDVEAVNEFNIGLINFCQCWQLVLAPLCEVCLW